MWMNLAGMVLAIGLMLVLLLLWYYSHLMIEHWQITSSLVLSLIGCFVLLIILYSNILAVILSSNIREVRIRLTLGARRPAIFLRIIFESFFLTMILVLFSMVLTEFILQAGLIIALAGLSLSSQPLAIQVLIAFGLTFAIVLIGGTFPILAFIKKMKPGIPPEERINPD